MNRETTDKYRGMLEDLSARLRGDIASLDDQARMGTGGDAGGNLSNTPMHLADLGTAVYLQELNATLLENQEYIREEVLAALGRIEEGRYGTCENCGTDIIEERLELLPYTRYCTPCAADLQAGRDINLNKGRPQTGAETMNPHDDDAEDQDDEDSDTEDSPLADDEIPLTNLETETTGGGLAGDVHAAGTAGGGTAIGGLAGTNIGEGDPADADLEDAMGSGNYDVELEEDDDRKTAYSGPAGGAAGGTPANLRSVGGKTGGGIAPQPEPGDSPTGQ
jgi:DnaK suppressor protein